VVRNGDVPRPVGVLAPHLGPARVLEEVGEVDVGRCIEVARDGVADEGHFEGGEEVAGREPAAAAVLGEGVEVEGVVAGLGHVAVADHFHPQERVHGLQKPGPVALTLDLAPGFGEALEVIL